jgi:predicted RNA-binding protein
MCEANAYIIKDGKEILYLENVDLLIPEEDKIYLRNLFGEQKTFNGYIKEISLLRHRIVLEEKEQP